MQGAAVKILDVRSLKIPDIKVIRFARFIDSRGFFAEHFRRSDFSENPQLDFMKRAAFLQCNESFSKSNTVRGLHFQWAPAMGKLVRTLRGRMTDMILDIRKGSPTLGKILFFDMPANTDLDWGEWIWVPPGFAHGNFFDQPSHIEYFCTAEYNPECEAGISPLAHDLDWSMCDRDLKREFDALISGEMLITDRDRNGHSLASWLRTPFSNNFQYPDY